MKTIYNKWLEYTNIHNQYCLYMSEKQFFGKKIKRRIKKKWYHRYLHDKNKEYNRLSLKKEDKYKIFFGKKYYSYNIAEKHLYGFTTKPKQKGCHCYTAGSISHAREHDYLI